MGDMAMSRGLRLKEKNIFWGMFFIILIHGIVDGKLINREKLIEINKKLKQINRPAVKSIQSEDGDIIDCVDIYKQPAFDHPALKNHTIQMRPSYDPALETSVKKDEVHGSLEASQLWRKSGSCPEGTIPIRRIRKQDLLRAASLEDFGRKNPSFSTIAGDIHQNSGNNYTIKAYNKAANHSTMQMRPSYDPALETSVKKDEVNGSLEASQLWRKSGSCPEGTIPIRRIRKQDLLRAASLEDFGRKNPGFSTIAGDIHQNGGNNFSTKAYNKAAGHSVAMLFSQDATYGAQGDINVWNPNVASDDEYSAAEIVIKDGPYIDFESVESGWMVNPKIYGDKRTRFFAYWTTDASKKTGCFDLTCPGFVQTSRSIVLGAGISPVSVINGAQYHISISIQMDKNTGQWWLRYGAQTIGYWPKSLFVGLSHMGSSVEWGGDVKSSHIGQTHPHTGTDMGSGRKAGDGFGVGCLINNIRTMDSSFTFKFPRYHSPYTDEENCYNTYYRADDIVEPEFYFGGPGYDEKSCP
ncbi:uncharacterized protein LOC122064588 [Macadamia integrifolia]|uniref:uncharacterized protein LOC122064588 n=1 Tax=Macadamia integrifolia TaxID=60698 RepID=UPI001C4F2511|nr:uncharacterized protein LOC122064588 [Macadamia integrifolia]